MKHTFWELRRALRRLYGQDVGESGGECESCSEDGTARCLTCGSSPWLALEDEEEVRFQPGLVAVRPGDTVLSLGDDEADDALVAAFLAGPEGRVTALLKDQENLLKFRLNLARQGSGKISLDRLKASLPVDDASFDAVVGQISLALVPDPARLTDEIGRVLRPGGRFSSLELLATARPLPPKVAEAGPVQSVPTTDQVAHDLAEAGLENIEIDALDDGPRIAAIWLGDDQAAECLTIALVTANKP